MNRIWLVTNAASGSFSAETLAALETQLEQLGCIVAETSDFPKSALPDAAMLDGADIDTLALYAGDGSIAAAIRHSAGWRGTVLVLPGGTMNLLAKRLHGDRTVTAIVAAAKAGRTGARSLHGASIAGHIALVGIIAGPVTAWAQAREDVREGAMAQLPKSLLEAVRETVTGEGIGVDGLDGSHRAVFIFPQDDLLETIAPAPGTFGETVQLGWDLLAGDWRHSPGTARIARAEILLRGTGPMAVLVDGEPVETGASVSITSIETSQNFVMTQDAA